MKKFKLNIIILSLALATLSSCKENKEERVADDGTDKSTVTETGQHIGGDTDSTSVISDEPNPSND
ncbi:MAG TPA: hypothetical protein VGB50_02610 [Flavobacterium sp.]|jgi:hypothetical protein